MPRVGIRRDSGIVLSTPCCRQQVRLLVNGSEAAPDPIEAVYERTCKGCGKAWQVTRKRLRINARDAEYADYEISWREVADGV